MPSATTIGGLIIALLWPWAANAQARAQAQSDWNGERVLGLVRQARSLRQATAVDSALQAYQADARGYVYFF
ncbi:MAG: hypothetical protein IH921_14980, partial [Gemmatimonadetes bacterium]|nr:hypothetical protein [Gemmatimonadota bacterium]